MADDADAKKYDLHRFFQSIQDGSVLKIKLAIVLQCNHAHQSSVQVQDLFADISGRCIRNLPITMSSPVWCECAQEETIPDPNFFRPSQLLEDPD
jgi:hypothetical protein